MLLDFTAAAAGKQRDDGPFRIEAMPRCEFFASHHRPNDIHERMADEIHRPSRLAIKFLFERENYDHALHQALDDANAPRSPSPDLRTDEVGQGNPDILEPARHAEMRPRRIDQNRQRRTPFFGFTCDAPLDSD